MKTITKNLKTLSLLISIGSLTLMAACGGSGSQALPAAEVNPAALEKPNETAVPAVPPKTCYVYSFVSDRDGEAQNIFLADTCNSQAPRRLTQNSANGTHFGDLAFTSDGTKLAFDTFVASSFRDIPSPKLITLPSSPGELPLPQGLSSVDLGAESRGEFLPRELAFEPQGNRIAFVAITPINETPATPTAPQVTSFPRSLKLFDPAAGLQELVSNTDVSVEIKTPVWHPDGQRIFFSMSSPFVGGLALNVFDLRSNRASGLIQQVGDSAIPNGLPGTSPEIRPDGKELAFVQIVGDRKQIFVCALEERSRFGTPLTVCRDPHVLTTLRENTEPSYTPDGQFILFTSNRDGNREIYQMRDDGSEQVNLTQNLSVDRGVAVSPLSFQTPGN